MKAVMCNATQTQHDLQTHPQSRWNAPVRPIQNHQHTHGRETLKLGDNSKQRRRRLLSADRKSRLREGEVSTGYSERILHSINVHFAFLISLPITVRHQQTRLHDDGLSNTSVFLCAGCLRASIISNGHSFENILMFAFPVLSTQQRYTVSGKYSRMGSAQKNLLL